MNKKISRIAMLSTHGYFDPVPVLGQTDTGGQVVYVLELAKALSKKGIKTDIYTRWFDKSKKQVDPVPGYPDINVIRIPAGPWKFIPKETIYSLLPELSQNMINFIDDHDLEYDLFHGHYVDAGIVTIDVSSYFEKPSYFTAHSLGAWKRDQMGGNVDEMEQKFNFKHRITEELRIFKTVNAQTVTSILQREKINELYGFIANNIVNIPPGVDIHTFKPLLEEEMPERTDLPSRYIYCISRIDTNKGHDYLLRAFALLSKRIKDINLVIGGGSLNTKNREKEVFDMIEEILDEYHLKNRVHVIGYVPDNHMAHYYQNCEVFILPSLFEPFGMTTQEAMACGKPVICSRYGGIRTVIKNGINGMLVDPSDAEEFARVIETVLLDESLKKNLGNQAYLTVINEFSWDAIADRFIRCYSDYM